MQYSEIITLKNGKTALLRNGEAADGDAVFNVFNQTHAETDFLLTYPDENSFAPEREASFLQEKTDSLNEIEILAIVDDKVVGTAGISEIGPKEKNQASRRIRHQRFAGILGTRAWKSLDKSLYSMCQRRRICSSRIECRCR